jgi:hypothetical protein
MLVPQANHKKYFCELEHRIPLCVAEMEQITRKYAKAAGVTWKPNEYKGFHSFRRSLGIGMLSA